MDDEEIFLKSLLETFREIPELCNCIFIPANSGEEAIEILKTTKVDLLVTDLKMPGIDGYKLLNLMGKDYPEIPIIIMTAYGTDQIREEVLRAGALYYIDKPFSPEQLAHLIRQALASYARGSVVGLHLVDFIQVVHMGRKLAP